VTVCPRSIIFAVVLRVRVGRLSHSKTSSFGGAHTNLGRLSICTRFLVPKTSPTFPQVSYRGHRQTPLSPLPALESHDLDVCGIGGQLQRSAPPPSLTAADVRSPSTPPCCDGKSPSAGGVDFFFLPLILFFLWPCRLFHSGFLRALGRSVLRHPFVRLFFPTPGFSGPSAFFSPPGSFFSVAAFNQLLFFGLWRLVPAWTAARVFCW